MSVLEIIDIRVSWHKHKIQFIHCRRMTNIQMFLEIDRTAATSFFLGSYVIWFCCVVMGLLIQLVLLDASPEWLSSPKISIPFFHTKSPRVWLLPQVRSPSLGCGFETIQKQMKSYWLDLFLFCSQGLNNVWTFHSKLRCWALNSTNRGFLWTFHSNFFVVFKLFLLFPVWIWFFFGLESPFNGLRISECYITCSLS